MKMSHDTFERWIRDRCRGCMEESEIHEICKGELECESGDYEFDDPFIQGQWEAWQAAKSDQDAASKAREDGF